MILFRVGGTVHHKFYGEGIIIAYENTPLLIKYLIQFKIPNKHLQTNEFRHKYYINSMWLPKQSLK